MSLLLTARPRASGDTFLMARQHILWPALATASGGTWVYSGDANQMFGGLLYNSSNSTTDYLEWANVVLSPGDYVVKALGASGSPHGIAHVSFAGADTGARLDTYGSSLYNQIWSDTFTVASKTRGTLRITMASKTGSQYYGYFTQFAIIKTSAGTDAGASVDDLPWIVDVPPVSFESGGTGPGTITQTTSAQWGSYITLSDAIDEYTEYKVWLPAGTWTLSLVHLKGTSGGIATATLDGSASLGTVDTYNGSTTYNNAGTITGIVVATTGIHTLRLTAAAKHASSGGYNLYAQWLQFRRTA